MTFENFNTIYIEFLRTLQTYEPNDPMLEFCISIVEDLAHKNIKAPARTFLTSVSPYSQNIMNTDEHFFLNTDFDVNNAMLQRVRSSWIDLSPSNKSTIWMYLKKLLLLSLTLDFNS